MCDITIVIPTWNRSSLLELCLQSILKQTSPCQVLVVDDGSTDSTEAVLKLQQKKFRGRLQYLKLAANRGFASAVNAGIRTVRTNFVALLNNDTEADPRWIEVGLLALNKLPEYSFFASRVMNFYQRGILDSAGDCYDRKGIAYKLGHGEASEEFMNRGEVVGASAAAAFYRRSLFDKIGWFDEDLFMYLEDVDLSLRAQLQGHRCLYLPDAVVYHIESASDPSTIIRTKKTPRKRNGFPVMDDSTLGVDTPSDQYYRIVREVSYSSTQVYWITRNRWQLMIKYQPIGNFPWLIYGWLKSVGAYFLKGKLFWSFLCGVVAGILQTPHALRKRRAIRQTEILSSSYIRDFLGRC